MKHMRPGSVLTITIAVLVAIASSVHADVGAVFIHGKDKVDPRERTVVTSAVTEILLDSKWLVSATTFTASEVKDISFCLTQDRPWPCIQPIASAKGLQGLVVVHVEHQGMTIIVKGQVIVRSDAVPAIEPRYCEACSMPNLEQTVKEMTKALLSRISPPPDKTPDKTAIEIRTVPRGASITIDGKPVVASDVTLPISAGPHQVQVQHPGYHTDSRSITITQDQIYKLEVTLTPDLSKPRSRLIPALLMSAGAIALAGGAIYSFTIDPPETFEQPRYLYSGPAIGVAGAGIAVLGLGIYLWFRSPREARSQSGPTASISPGGGVFGWSTSF